MRKADRIEIVRRAQARGISLNEVERLTGINSMRYVKTDQEAS